MTFTDIKPPGSGGSGPDEDAARLGAGTPRLASAAGIVAALLAAAAVLLGTGSVLLDGQGEGVRTVRVPAPPPLTSTADSLVAGQTLAELLARNGFGPRAAHRVVRTVREYEEPRDLQPGTRLVVRRRPLDEEVRELELRLDADRSLELRRDDASWRGRLDSVPVTVDTIVVAGLVRNSLFDATLLGDTADLAPNEDVGIVHALEDIYQWRLDFFRDLRTGDAFRLVIRRKVRPDGTLRSARVLGSEFRNGSRHLWAIHYDSPDPSVDGYYSLEGESLRTRFLRAPLEYRRVTSGFSRSRYHPVLERRRAHLGIDYGANTGTPVRATGEGVVSRRRWWGGYGRMVEIRHSGPYRTRYAHLSAFAPGLDVGERVEQGEVIGRVGASGNTTGPHLHYEFLVNGEQRDPADLQLPPGNPVPEDEMDRFVRQKEAAVAALTEHRLPRTSMLASNSDSDGEGGRGR